MIVHRNQRKKISPRLLEGLKMERVRRVELPTLCLASIDCEKKLADESLRPLTQICELSALFLIVLKNYPPENTLENPLRP
jgi:hypothetical protein